MANTYNTKQNITVPTYQTTPNYSNYSITTNGSSAWSVANNPVMTIRESTTLEVKGNMVINGRDLEERLDTIEKVLMIPERDVKLEEKYPKLKKMYDEYIKELAKARMWESLKGTKND
jgi:hypothetical protein